MTDQETEEMMNALQATGTIITLSSTDEADIGSYTRTESKQIKKRKRQYARELQKAALNIKPITTFFKIVSKARIETTTSTSDGNTTTTTNTTITSNMAPVTITTAGAATSSGAITSSSNNSSTSLQTSFSVPIQPIIITATVESSSSSNSSSDTSSTEEELNDDTGVNSQQIKIRNHSAFTSLSTYLQ
jgi:hypothetical protein